QPFAGLPTNPPRSASAVPVSRDRPCAPKTLAAKRRKCRTTRNCRFGEPPLRSVLLLAPRAPAVFRRQSHTFDTRRLFQAHTRCGKDSATKIRREKQEPRRLRRFQ